jgi:hypothetical protein
MTVVLALFAMRPLPARRPAVVLAAAALLVATSAHAQFNPTAPRVITGPSGEADIVFANGCTMSFDAKGREARRGIGCTPQQAQEAAQLNAQRRLPPVTAIGSGYLRVVPSRTCTVTYGPTGQREGTPRECSREELAAADAAAANFRAQQGAQRPGAVLVAPLPGTTGNQPPAAAAQGTRAGRLVMSGEAAAVYFDNGCVASIERFGSKAAGNRLCAPEQLRRAEQLLAIEAMNRAVREQQGQGN